MMGENSSKTLYDLTTAFAYISNASDANTTSRPPKVVTTEPHHEIASANHKILVLTIYILVFLFGTVGNLLTCYIIISRKFMRRVIHIYTFNLAVSDLLVILIYIPVEMVRNESNLQWTMGTSMCKISYIVTPTSLISSVFTLVAITLDRHRGVTRPFKWRGDSTRQLWFSIPAIWLIAITCSAPLFHYSDTVLEKGKWYCVETWTSKFHDRLYWSTMFFVMVVAPLAIIIVANAHMICVMKRLSIVTNHSDREQHKQHRRMIRMVVALVLVYALCSSPQHVVYFWFQFGNLEANKELSVHIFKAANLMVIFQSAINPVIYGIGRRDFKGAFKNIFQCLNLRELITSSKAETQVGAVPSLMMTLKNVEISTWATENDDFSQLNSRTEHSAALPLINKKLEAVRRKSVERRVTDTPPIRRPFTASLPPVHNRHRNGGLSREQNMSLPATNEEGALRRQAKTISFKGFLNDAEDCSQNRASFSAEIHLDEKELNQIAHSPESCV